MARIALVAGLVVEILYLTVRFDTQSLGDTDSGWLQLIAWSPQYLRLAITVAVVFVLLTATRLSSRAVNAGTDLSTRTRVAWSLVHAAALLLFVQVSGRIFQTPIDDSVAAAWVLGWFALGSLTLLSWMMVFLCKRLSALSACTNRALAGAAVGLGGLAWLGGFLSEGLWRAVAGQTFTIVERALRLFGDVVSRPDTLVVGTQTFTVQIAPSCSGLEGVGLHHRGHGVRACVLIGGARWVTQSWPTPPRTRSSPRTC